MNRIDDVVNFFMSKSAMSPKKLQKLLYYAYGWTLALLNESVDEIHNKWFDDPIESWIHLIHLIFFLLKQLLILIFYFHI